MATLESNLNERTQQLEERVIDPCSTLSIDSLLDSINALIYDSEGVKKTKNFEGFYSKCKNLFSFEQNNKLFVFFVL